MYTILRYIELEYYDDKFKSQNNNPKQIWNSIKQLNEQ